MGHPKQTNKNKQLKGKMNLEAKYLRGKEDDCEKETSLSASSGHEQLFRLICQPFGRPCPQSTNGSQKEKRKKKMVIKLEKKKGRQLTAGLGGGVFKPHANDPNRSSNGSLVLSNKTSLRGTESTVS